MWLSGKNTPETRPLAVCGIIFGICVIVLAFMAIYIPSVKSAFHTILFVIYIIAALAGLAYGGFYALRDKSGSSWVSKLFRFFIFPAIVFAVFGFSIYFTN
jgi:hypothetical protein